MTDARTLRIVVAAASAASGVVGYGLVLASDHEPKPKAALLLFIALGWIFVASGLVATIRRSDSRFGWLLAWVGLTWFLGALAEANDDLTYTAGLLLGGIWIAVFIWAVLVYPDGRLDSRSAKATLVVVVTITTVVQWFGALWLVPDREIPDCARGCPQNLALVRPDHDLYELSATVQSIGGLLTAVGVVIVVVMRYRRASTALRRAIAPVFLATGGFVVGWLVIEVIDSTRGVSDGVRTAVTLGLFALVPLAFLGGVLRSRLSQGSVGRLVVELQETAAQDARAALGRALHDPSVEIAYWIAESGTYVDAAGHPVAITDRGDRATTFVEHAGMHIAAVTHDPSLDENPHLVQSACAALGIALANERLQAELRGRLDELRASRARIVEAGDAERRRLERNLHDGAQQRLVALALTLRLIHSKVRDAPEEAETMLANAGTELDAAIVELRDLAQGIHPAVLDRGLGPALETLANREPLPVDLHYELDERAPAPVEAAAYYVVAEALTNIAKHADARSADVRVRRRDGRIVVEVADDGHGGASLEAGTGLRGLKDRVESLDGRLRIESATSGTRVTAELPLAG